LEVFEHAVRFHSRSAFARKREYFTRYLRNFHPILRCSLTSLSTNRIGRKPPEGGAAGLALKALIAKPGS
jgi:hypothetical protein